LLGFVSALAKHSNVSAFSEGQLDPEVKLSILLSDELSSFFLPVKQINGLPPPPFPDMASLLGFLCCEGT